MTTIKNKRWSTYIPRVDILPERIKFNAEMCKQANLEENSFATLFYDADNGKVAFRFSKEVDKTETNYKVVFSNTKSIATCSSKGICDEPWYKEMLKIGPQSAYMANYVEGANLWTIKLVPDFEICHWDGDIEDMPDDISALYWYTRYPDAKTKERRIMYIGDGNVKKGLGNLSEEDLGLIEVGYSIIKPEYDVKWKDFFLSVYKHLNDSKLPKYNQIEDERS